MKRFLAVLIFGLSSLASAQTSSPMWFQVPFSLATPAIAPTFSPSAGPITSGTPIVITSSTSGVTICYTLNGDTPTAATPGTCDSDSGNEYSISNGGSTSAITSPLTVNAIATKAGLANSSPASAAYTIALGMSVVQRFQVAMTGGGSGPTWPVTLTATPANASIIINCSASADISSFSLTGTQILSAGASVSGGFWVFSSVPTGTPSFSVTLPGAYTQGNCEGAVVSGLQNSSPVDQPTTLPTAFSSSSYSTSITTGAVTTTHAADVILGVAAQASSVTYMAGAGYTLIGSSCTGLYCSGIEYLNVSATGTYNPPMTQNFVGLSAVGTVALKLQ